MTDALKQGVGVAPSRERGSKQGHGDRPAQGHVVAPSRERGSKLERGGDGVPDEARSLPHGSADRNLAKPRLLEVQAGVAPSRERGSKRDVERELVQVILSLPYGSADRNIFLPSKAKRSRRSLPHGSADRNRVTGRQVPVLRRRSLTGARIETLSQSRGPIRSRVAPSRERGSKRRDRDACRRPGRSLPHGSADRNEHPARGRRCHVVAPSRERGSKQVLGLEDPDLAGVAPSRERGSKHACVDDRELQRGGRSLTGARIETSQSISAENATSCRSLTGARIETQGTSDERRACRGRSLTGARIETSRATAPRRQR